MFITFEAMFPKLVAFVMIFAVLSANFSRFFVYAGFEFNKNYIAANLCENRAQPVLKCLGKCYLKKQLKEASQNEKKQEQASKKTTLQEAFLSKVLQLNFPPQPLLVNTIKPLKVKLYKTTALIFHPPQDILL